MKLPTTAAIPSAGGAGRARADAARLGRRSRRYHAFRAWHDRRHQRGAGTQRRAHRPDHHRGFQDVLEIGRQMRHSDVRSRAAAGDAGVPRAGPLPQGGDGTYGCARADVVVPLDEASVERAIEELVGRRRSRRSRSAWCSRFSTRTHERRIRDMIQAAVSRACWCRCRPRSIRRSANTSEPA